MRLRPAAVVVLIALVSACATAPVRDRESTCRVVQIYRGNGFAGLGPRQLAELARGTPAEDDARSAYAQNASSIAIGSVGAGALAAGFILGFVPNKSQVDQRNAGYGLVGGAIGLFAIALTLGFTGRAAADRARAELTNWRECP